MKTKRKGFSFELAFVLNLLFACAHVANKGFNYDVILHIVDLVNQSIQCVCFPPGSVGATVQFQ